MQTKNYTTDLLPLIKALCGVEFAAIELPRIRAMINSRAKAAFRASNWWPRFLTVGEERTVTNGVIGYTESGLNSIDTFLRIYRQQPFQTASVQEFDFTLDASGAKIVQGNLGTTSAWVTYKRQWTDSYGDGSSGTVVNVPDEWFEYLAHGTYADYLRSEGQQEKAALADQEAMQKLTDELMRVDEQTNGIAARRFNTVASNQTRWT